MLNENSVFKKEETKSYPLLKEDVYQVQLIDINEKESNKYQSTETEMKLHFSFAILQGKNIDGDDAKGRVIDYNFIPNYLYISKKTGKNKLYQVVEALLGRELELKEEAEGITGKLLNELINKQVRVFVENKTKEDKSFSNIIKLSPIDSEMTHFTLEELNKIKQGIQEYQNKKAEKMVKTVDPGAEEVTDEDLKNIPF